MYACFTCILGVVVLIFWKAHCIRMLLICSNLNMKFRNYLPHDKQLQEGKLAAPVLPKFEDPVAILPVPEEKKEVFNLSLLSYPMAF